MKYLFLCLMLFLGLSVCANAIEIGEGQVMRLSASKKRAIIKIDKLDFKNAKRLYLSSGLNDEPIALQVIKVKNNYAIVKTLRGVIDKYTLYEVFLERPNLDKFKRRKLQEVEEEDREIRYMENRKHHYISVNGGFLSLNNLVDEGEEQDTDFSIHFGYGLKYKFRAENDLGFLVEYMSQAGHMTSATTGEDQEFSSTFTAYKLGLLTQFEIGLYMQGGLTFHELTTKLSIEDLAEIESKSTGQGYFFAVGFERNFKASNWFYQYELSYYILDYKKTELTTGDTSTSETEEDLKQKAIGFNANFGYSF